MKGPCIQGAFGEGYWTPPVPQMKYVRASVDTTREPRGQVIRSFRLRRKHFPDGSWPTEGYDQYVMAWFRKDADDRDSPQAIDSVVLNPSYTGLACRRDGKGVKSGPHPYVTFVDGPAAAGFSELDNTTTILPTGKWLTPMTHPEEQTRRALKKVVCYELTPVQCYFLWARKPP
jgi:hypothetical protein